MVVVVGVGGKGDRNRHTLEKMSGGQNGPWNQEMWCREGDRGMISKLLDAAGPNRAAGVVGGLLEVKTSSPAGPDNIRRGPLEGSGVKQVFRTEWLGG